MCCGDDQPQQPTSQSVTQNTIDPAMVPYYTNIARTAQGLMNEAYTPYTDKRVANFSRDQQTAMGGIMGLKTPQVYQQARQLYNAAGDYAAGQYQAPEDYRPDTFASGYRPDAISSTYNPTDFASGYTARGYTDPRAAALYGRSQYRPDTFNAMPTMGQYGAASPFERMAGMERYAGPTGVGEAGVFGGAEAAQYMSPYQQNVTDIAARKAREENARQMMLGQAAAGQMGGGRGGSGEAIMKANLARSLVQDVGDIYGKGQQAAYESAQSQFERDRAARLGYGQVNLGGAQQGYQLNQATQAQNVAQNIAQYNAAEQARQNAYGLNLQGQGQAANQALAAFQANQQARQAAEQMRQSGYGLNLQAQGQNEAQRLAAYNALESARQTQNAQGLAAYQANQQAQQAAMQDRLAAFQATQQAQQFGATNALDAYRANQQAEQFAAQQNAAQSLAAFQANEQARQFENQQQLAAAQGLTSLGTARQQADLARLGAQMDVGQMRTARQQQLADINYQNYLEQRDWRANRLAQMAGVTMGLPTPISSNQIVYSQVPGVAQTLAGLGGAAYSAYRGTR